MKNEKKTEELFQAFGKIDPEFIAEAEPGNRAVQTRPLRRILPIAAAVAVLVVLVAVLSILLPKRSAPVLPEKENPGKSSELPGDKSADPMEDILLSAAEKADVLSENAQSCRLQPGATGLIWQTEENGPCYFHVLTPEQIDRLETMIPQGHMAGNTENRPDVRVWLVGPDGTVQTPYLRQGKGNEDFLRLQDYVPELIPSDAFMDACRQLLSGG